MSTIHAPGHRPARIDRRASLWILALVVVAVVAFLVGHDVFQSSSSNDGTKGSGIAATSTRAVDAFTAVDLSGANQVVIRVGEPRAVVVHGDANLLPLVTTAVSGGELRIANERSFSTNAPMRVDVSVPTLEQLSLSGAGSLEVQGIDARKLAVNVDGSGLVGVQGRVDSLDVTLSGSANVVLDGLVARDARAVLSGSGQIRVNATRTLDASIPGSGVIVVLGHPAVTQDISGSGVLLHG